MIVRASPGDKRHTIQSVQALRAFAASQVLIGHILLDIVSRYHVPMFGLTKLPWLTGVDIFFCVSGFIMMLTSWDHFQEKGYPATFMLHRVVRVVPLYYVFTTLMVGVVLVSPQMLGATKLDFTQIVTSYLFLPFQRSDGEIQPVLSVGWTLNYEMFFYAIFALALFCRRRLAFALLATAFTALAILHCAASDVSTALGFWTNPIILEFVAGAGVAMLYRHGIRLRRHPTIALVGVSSAILLFYARDALVDALGLHPPHMLQVGVPALLLLASCTLLIPEALDRRCPRWIVALGDSSYALYLSHRFGMRAAAALWSVVIGLVPSLAGYHLAYAFAVFVGCVVTGHAVHLGLEKPLTRLIARSMRRPSRTKPSMALQPIDIRP